MKTSYTINAITGSGIDEMIRGLDEYRDWLNRKSAELAERLSTLGAVKASIDFSRAWYSTMYNQNKPIAVTVEKRGEAAYAVIASGEEVLFVEFGVGIKWGAGHKEPHGFGPGTWPPANPDNPNWNKPQGWWLPKALGGEHTYGNPPNAVMYYTVRELEEELARIVREVFVP